MSTITIADKFARTEDFASRLDNAFFADEVWAVFAELDQPASAAQIADRLHESPDVVLNAINLLLEHQLVRRQLKSWRDFLAQKGADGPANSSTPATAPVAEARAAGRPGSALAGWPKPGAPTGVPEEAPVIGAVGPDLVAGPPAPVPTRGSEASSGPAETVPPPVLFTDFQLPTKPLHETHESASTPAPAPMAVSVPAAIAPPQPTSPAPSANGTVMPVSFTIANEKARFERKATVAMTIAFRISAKSTATATAWKLRPLLHAIEQKGGGGLPGQLLVYRVFIHVPADMMHAAGIQSLSLVDDSVVVRDRAFYDALCQAAHAVASIDLRTVAA